MSCLYTDENHSYLYTPIIMKKAQAKEIPRPLMPWVFLTQKKLMPWSLCDPLTLFLSSSLSIQIESQNHHLACTKTVQLPWVLLTEIPTGKTVIPPYVWFQNLPSFLISTQLGQHNLRNCLILLSFTIHYDLISCQFLLRVVVEPYKFFRNHLWNLFKKQQ